MSKSENSSAVSVADAGLLKRLAKKVAYGTRFQMHSDAPYLISVIAPETMWNEIIAALESSTQTQGAELAKRAKELAAKRHEVMLAFRNPNHVADLRAAEWTASGIFDFLDELAKAEPTQTQEGLRREIKARKKARSNDEPNAYPRTAADYAIDDARDDEDDWFLALLDKKATVAT